MMVPLEQIATISLDKGPSQIQHLGGKRTITVETIRFVGNDVALADGRYEIAGAAGGQGRKMWTALLLSRTPQGWRIAAIRNMLPAAGVGQALPPAKR